MRTARLAGGLYLALAPFSAFGLMYVPSALVVPGDAEATARNLAASESLFRAGVLSTLVGQVIFVVVVLTLYRLLRAVNEPVALLMIVLALIGVPMAFLNEVNRLAAVRQTDSAPMMQLLDQWQSGILVTLVFWGLWLLPLGLLVFRSGFLPRLLGVLVGISGAVYTLEAVTQILVPGFPTISQFTFLGELSLPLWLLVRGVDVERVRTLDEVRRGVA